MLVESALFILTLYILVYLRTKKLCRDFDKAGIRYVQPYPIFGNFIRVIFGLENVGSVINNIQLQFPHDKYIGLFNFMSPVILLRDNDLIRDVTIKDFSNFTDRAVQISHEVEPIISRILGGLRGQEWKEMRATLSPVFTSSKIRNMYGFTTQCAKQLITYYEDLCNEEKTKGSEAVIDVEARDLITRFTNDVIASAAFGLNVDSFKEKDNQFLKMGQIVSCLSVPKFLGYSSFPKLMTLLRIKLLPEECGTFFKKLVKESIQYREDNNMYRPDMIQLLMEIKKGTLSSNESSIAKNNEKREKAVVKTTWTDEDLAAQALVFFLAGFDAATISANFLFFTLISMPEVQEKLYEEILETRRKHSNNITYEIIHSMKYLDMVISETLRRWPSVNPFIDRMCANDYTLCPARNGAKEYTMKKGSVVWISLNCVHQDPQYWTDPEMFIPERFSDENKQYVKAGSYIPFGYGPRVCIGTRFALMELKVLAFFVVDSFQILKGPKTQDNLEIEPSHFNVRIKGGVWIKLKLRQNQMNQRLE